MSRALGLVAEVSGSTIWRWLNEDAIRTWQHRSWLFPRDPDFALKAGSLRYAVPRGRHLSAPLKSAFT